MKTTILSSSSSTMSIPNQLSNYDDELFMTKNLLFSDSLKDLKNLRSQLYSAAEYFEAAYPNDKQKEIMVSNLKDYTIKALVNTVDHLGSLTHKVNLLVDEKVDEVSATELRVSCIEQRLRTCQAHIDHEGLTQQSLLITTPKHHKRYILPVGESVLSSGSSIQQYQGCSLGDEDNWNKLKNAVRTTFRNTPPSSLGNTCSPSPIPTKQNHQEQTQEDEDNWKKLKNAVKGTTKNTPPSFTRKTRSPSPIHNISKQQVSSLEDEDNWKKLKNAVRGTVKTHLPSSVRKTRSPSPTLRPSLQHGLFSFRDKPRVADKQPDSPRSKFPLLRSGSVSARSSPKSLSRSTTPIPSRSTTPILTATNSNPSSNARKRYPSEPRKSFVTRTNADNKDNQKDIEHHQSKSKRILKALLSRRKSKKDDVLYTFLDEY